MHLRRPVVMTFRSELQSVLVGRAVCCVIACGAMCRSDFVLVTQPLQTESSLQTGQQQLPISCMVCMVWTGRVC